LFIICEIFLSKFMHFIISFDCINMLKQLTQASFWIKWVMECTLTIFLSEMVWQFIKRGIIVLVNKKRKKERYSKDWASWLWQWRNKHPLNQWFLSQYTSITLVWHWFARRQRRDCKFAYYFKQSSSCRPSSRTWKISYDNLDCVFISNLAHVWRCSHSRIVPWGPCTNFP
jgi:hypothetical protein